MLPGYEQARQPGAPQVPFSAVLVAIPPGAQPVLELLRLDEIQISLPAPVERAGVPSGVLSAPDGQDFGGAFVPADQTVQFELEPVILEPLGSLRGVRLARLVFYPARPQGNYLRLARYVQVALKFNSTAGLSLNSSLASDQLLSVIQPAVINPQHFQPGPAPISTSTEYRAVLNETGQAVVIEVEQPGLTAITYQDLAEVGFPVAGVNPLQLRLSRAGVQIPLEWDGDADPLFEPGERLLFYAQPRFSRWTRADVYFLREADSPGPPIPARSADPAGLPAGVAWVEASAEENLLYTPDCFCAPIPIGRDGDRWVWDSLQWPDKQTASYAIQLSAINTGQPASLKLWLIGYTDVSSASIDHHVEVSLNGTELGDVQWNGKQAIEAAFQIPTSVLKNGENLLALTLPGLPGINVEGVWLDAFSIRYSRSGLATGDALLFSGEESRHAYTLGLGSTNGLRLYDVTDPDHPYRLQGFTTGAANTVSLGDPEGGAHRYWITNESAVVSPARLRLAAPLQSASGFEGVDYIIITHAGFLTALDSLVSLRQQQGLSVVVEDVQAIYDVFGDGRTDPQAIQAFLAHAYTSWNPRPAYVLLVGDGTSDPKRYSQGSSHTFIPPYLADVEPWAGETAADNRYATLDGDDNLPDMLIGRLPVNSLAEAQNVVEKIVQYEQDPTPGNWTSAATFVADDPDGGGDFLTLSDAIVNSFFPPPRTPRRLYLEPPVRTAEAVRQALFEDWNAGISLLMYTGHASIHQWAVEQFFHYNDIPSLENGARLPVLLEMTCFTASFQVPGIQTLDEALLRHPAGGVIAAWGSTGLGISTGHKDLADGFLQTIFHQAGADLGKAALAGKLNLAVHSPEFGDLIDTFTLLGDPATRLMLETGSTPIYLPIIQN